MLQRASAEGSEVKKSKRTGRWARNVLGACVLACLLILQPSSALAGTTYVDGLSGQNLNAWNNPGHPWNGPFEAGSFAEFFGNSWVTHGHIRLAREVAQWNTLSGKSPGDGFLTEFEHQYKDLTSSGFSEAGHLTLDLSLTNYVDTGKKTEEERKDQVYQMPSSASQYKNELEKLLVWGLERERHGEGQRFSYVEPWNEPNAQGEMKGTLVEKEGEKSRYTASAVAEYTQAAEEACNSYGCTVIAGNVYATEEGGSAKWEKEYKTKLEKLGREPKTWGIHPYWPVEKRSLSMYEESAKEFPSNATVIFTEVGVYRCYNEGKTELSEYEQAEDAKWLVLTLMPKAKIQPAHVFYYDPYQYTATCRNEQNNPATDTGLYQVTSNPWVPDKALPRAAASWILDNKDIPWAFTGSPPAAHVSKRSVYLEGLVLPGGDDAESRFEYGLNTGYGDSTGGEGEGGSGESLAAATVEGLTPGTTYHFRLKAWNGESGGEDYSGDATFTTEVAPPLVGAQTVNVGATTAKLAAQIEPEGFETKYHFEYGREAGKYTGSTTEETLKEKGTGWESVRAEVSGLEVCQTYHFRVVATNQDGTVDESDQEFKTECLPPEVVTGVASELQPHSATVSGTVNPEGEAGSFQFEYGTSNKFGSLAPEVAGGAGEGRGTAPVSAGLTNLKQHATYHYRLSASNARGVSKGSEDTFETLYAPPRVCGEKAAESAA